MSGFAAAAAAVAASVEGDAVVNKLRFIIGVAVADMEDDETVDEDGGETD